MDKDIRKGRICALLAAGLHMEGLLRVALERAEEDPVLETEIRDTFKRYSVIFDSIFPEECEQHDEPEIQAEPEKLEELEEQNATKEADAEPAVSDIPVSPVVAEISIEEDKDADNIEKDNIEKKEDKVEITYVSDRPLSDALKVDELIARKESADLRKAFTLNDKFRFRRTIFGGSDDLFSNTLEQLERLPDFKSALALLTDILPKDGEDNEDFLNIVKQHFDSRQ